MDASPKYVLALEEARRASDAQRASLATVRGLAATTVTTAGLVGTFLGGIRVHNHLTAWTLVALIAFTGVVGACGWILLPVARFRTTQDASVIVAWTDEHAADDDTQRKHLALAMTKQYEENAAHIKRRQKAYFVAMVFLVAEMTALVIDLRGGEDMADEKPTPPPTAQPSVAEPVLPDPGRHEFASQPPPSTGEHRVREKR